MPLWAPRPSLSWYVPLQCPGRGVAQGVRSSLLSSSRPGLPLPGGPWSSCLPHPAPLGPQVNMLIGIVVFNKLMARDGISDKSKKQRAG